MTGIKPHQKRLKIWIKIPIMENTWIRNETNEKVRGKIRLNKIRKSIGLAHNINFISVR